jgi:DNA-binding MarR family transcriptional regulator
MMEENRIGYSLKRAQHAIRLAMDQQLSPLGLSTAQYAALYALQVTPDSSNATLARVCFVTPQSMNEIVRGLEQAGYITRHSHPEHKRIVQYRLTETGLAKIEAAHGIVKAVEAVMIEGLSVAESEQLHAMLRRCHQNLEQRYLQD